MSMQSSSTPGQETMDRGSSREESSAAPPGTDLMKEKLEPCDTMEIQHDRRGCLQECFCCITKSQFRYYNGKKKIARSKEEFTFVCRCCLAPCHAIDMTITDVDARTNATVPDKDSEFDDEDDEEEDGPEEFLEVNRPFRYCLGTCKCCCNQEATIFSGDDHLGDIRENFWCCIPQFSVYDDNEEEIYIIKPPTCLNGLCIKCAGPDDTGPCPHGCCMVPCDIYPISDEKVVDPIGRMAKIPKKSFGEVFNETNYYKIDFPKEATASQKGLLLGSSILINALYFENSE